MLHSRYIYPINKRYKPDLIGKKGHAIVQLMSMKMQVPITYVCDTDAYQKYVKNNHVIFDSLIKQLEKHIDLNKTYAIRSSANIEDGIENSFAGQFNSILNVKGGSAIIEAIKEVWTSAESPNVKSYLEKKNINPDNIHMAVLIQEMVPPHYSGVALSRNPVTGANEIVIEAVQGEGTNLMQQGLTPERWINKFGYWIEKPKNSRMPIEIIEQIVKEIKEVESKLDYPVDMEWVFDGKKLFWVQVREISAINKLNVYSNYLSREMIPGMQKPLSFAISVPIMSSGLLKWLSEILGDIDIVPKDLVKSFYYRAYFNMGAMGKLFKKFGLPAESLELLIGALPPGSTKPKMKPTLKTFSRLPKILLFLLKNNNLRNKLRADLDKLEIQLDKVRHENFERFNSEELLPIISKHIQLTKDIGYITSLSMLLLSMYNRALKRQLARRGVDISDFDLTENMTELDNYYPSAKLNELKSIFLSLPNNKQEEISNTEFTQIMELDGIDPFLSVFNDLLENFGHLGDSGNDFSIPPWRETPDLVLKMVIDYNPLDHESQKKVCLSDLKTKHQTTPLFMLLYNRAREYQFLREKASCLYTKGKIIFRYYFLALGNQFVQRNILGSAEDIFYLTPSQIEEVVNGDRSPSYWRSIVLKEKEDMRHYESIQLPTVIYGEDPPPIFEKCADTLIGTPTSIGFYTGDVCVVKNMHEFSKLKKGEVLVIPHSDVSWSPLFAQAGALISESGGLLSHGSIIAREYRIPAIVSVANATIIPDGTRVAVDAYHGVVKILSE